jgi:flagellar M-ring protein FliF
MAGSPSAKRVLPAAGAFLFIVLAGLAYLALAAGPERTLYTDLNDAERAEVVEALEAGGIGYAIDSATGRISVAEDDLYRARMLVASSTGLAAPPSATDMLDNIPMGASRTMEGERLRLARERELMMTIMEIDGISSVRVHLATPERSVFVRQNNPPTASVMVRLKRGRTLGQDQVAAIVNLVAGSVPGLSSDAVRVVDQNGRLLSEESNGPLDALVLQREFETKLRDQIAQLLTPMLGEGNFSSEVQVALEQSEVTSARESYEPEGKVRSENIASATRRAGQQAGGVPGVLANTPPPPADLEEGAPEADNANAAADDPPTDTEESAQRRFELDREVSVTTSPSGRLQRLSVAVAVDEEALEAIAPATAESLQELIAAAVGADEERGDNVAVIPSAFEEVVEEEPAFYENQWFDLGLRYGGAFLALILLLFFGVRPLLKRLKPPAGSEDEDEESEDDEEADSSRDNEPSEPVDVATQVELARQLAIAQPERAVAALQRMLAAPRKEGEGAN